MAIPREITEKVRETADISEVVGEYVRLIKRGYNYVGLCPFHKEKTPSFTVSPDKGIYKCFGCGKSGNVFSFLMENNGFTFPEAVEHLAKKYNISYEVSASSNELSSRAEKAYSALKSAAEIFASELHSKRGITAMKYFYKRQFSTESIEKFLLGYSPDSWNFLEEKLLNAGHEKSTLVETGLSIEKENRTYDRFRNRTMFPVRDFVGRVIGFGARMLGDEPNQPKYLNSPQTLVYDKSRVLYGLFEARSAIRANESAILTEGYADVITLHQAGIENVVASSGTALTPEQLELLSRYTKNLYIVYDADQAGLKAATRGLGIALESGFDVKIVTLPQGEDPDSLVRNHGKNTFRNYLEKALGFIEFMYNDFERNGVLSTPAGKAGSIRNLLKIIAKIPDKLQHDFYIQEISKVFNLNIQQVESLYREKNRIKINETTLFNEREQIIEQKSEDNKGETPDPAYGQKEIAIRDELHKLPAWIDDEISREELLLIKVYLEKREYFDYFENLISDVENEFFSPLGKKLHDAVFNLYQESSSIFELIFTANLEPDIRDILSSIALPTEKLSEKWIGFGFEPPDLDHLRNITDPVQKRRLFILEQRLLKLKSFIDNDLGDMMQNMLQYREISTQINEIHKSLNKFKK